MSFIKSAYIFAFHRINKFRYAGNCFHSNVQTCASITELTMIEKSYQEIEQSLVQRIKSLNVEEAKKWMNEIAETDSKYLSLPLYNALFETFARCDCIWQSEAFIDSMIGEFGIVPSIETVVILINGCRKKANVCFAEKIWESMVKSYHLTPTLDAYAAMIGVYAMAGNQISAERLFRQMTVEQRMLPNIVVCSHMMKAFAENKNIKKVIKMKQFMQAKEMKLTGIEYVILMTAHLKVDAYENALREYEEYSKMTNNKEPNVQLFALRLVSFLGMLKVQKQNISKRNFYYHLITEPTLIKLNRLTMNEKIASIQLHAAIIHFDDNFEQILVLFERLRAMHFFQYWSDDCLSIDLHGFGYEVAGFLLIYILKFESKRLLDMHCIQILCGRERHKDSKSALLGHSNCKNIREYIAKKLMSLSPPIRSENSKAFLILNKQDVVKYYSNLDLTSK